MWDLSSPTRDRKRGVLTTGPPGKSLHSRFPCQPPLCSPDHIPATMLAQASMARLLGGCHSLPLLPPGWIMQHFSVPRPPHSLLHRSAREWPFWQTAHQYCTHQGHNMSALVFPLIQFKGLILHYCSPSAQRCRQKGMVTACWWDGIIRSNILTYKNGISDENLALWWSRENNESLSFWKCHQNPEEIFHIMETSSSVKKKRMINCKTIDSPNFYFFWSCCVACGTLVPRPGIKPVPLALGAWSLNHWTAREVPTASISSKILCPSVHGTWVNRNTKQQINRDYGWATRLGIKFRNTSKSRGPCIPFDPGTGLAEVLSRELMRHTETDLNGGWAFGFFFFFWKSEMLEKHFPITEADQALSSS